MDHRIECIICIFVTWFIMVYLKFQKEMKNPLIEDIKYPLFKKILNRIYILCAIAGVVVNFNILPVIVPQFVKYLK